MISSLLLLLHLVGLRPRVYYTLNNFRGGGGVGKAPLGSSPPIMLNTPMYNTWSGLLLQSQLMTNCLDHQLHVTTAMLVYHSSIPEQT